MSTSSESSYGEEFTLVPAAVAAPAPAPAPAHTQPPNNVGMSRQDCMQVVDAMTKVSVAGGAAAEARATAGGKAADAGKEIAVDSQEMAIATGKLADAQVEGSKEKQMLLGKVADKSNISFLIDGTKELFQGGKVVITGGGKGRNPYKPEHFYAVVKTVNHQNCVLQVRDRATDEVVEETIERHPKHVMSLQVWMLIEAFEGEHYNQQKEKIDKTMRQIEAREYTEVDESWKALDAGMKEFITNIKELAKYNPE